jgi:hypothetical protein
MLLGRPWLRYVKVTQGDNVIIVQGNGIIKKNQLTKN